MKHLLAGLVTSGLLMSLPVSALAHAALSSSNIESGTSIAAAPETLELTFGKSVGLAILELVQEGSNAVTDLAPYRDMAKAHSAVLPNLKQGSYKIRWRAVASDGHVMKGEISFTVTAD